MPPTLRQRFAAMANQPEEAVDLAAGALMIAERGDPGMDPVAALAQLEALAHAARPHVEDAGDAQTRAGALNRFFFEVEGFSGNAADYYDRRNSFLHQVLARRTGIPITLAVLYMEVGRRVGLRVEGINFPGHFLVKLVEPGVEVLIDPFTGTIVPPESCAERLRQLAGEDAAFDPAMLQQAPKTQILRRMLTNLKLIAVQEEHFDEALGWTDLAVALTDDPGELRDRGLLHFRLERFVEAAADLERFVALLPADDAAADAVQPYLAAARRRAVTRYN